MFGKYRWFVRTIGMALWIVGVGVQAVAGMQPPDVVVRTERSPGDRPELWTGPLLRTRISSLVGTRT